MEYTEDNDYGCTKSNGVSDMSKDTRILIEQLDDANIPYTRTSLAMGTLTADPAYLVHYAAPKTGRAITVLVIPQSGADSWAEEYYHFPGMTPQIAAALNWHTVYKHVQRVSMDTLTASIPPSYTCPACGERVGIGMQEYSDIRGRKRCSNCHAILLPPK